MIDHQPRRTTRGTAFSGAPLLCYRRGVIGNAAMLDFIPQTPVLLAYSFAVIVLALTPGPDMTLHLGKTIGQSRTAGVAAFLGTSTGLRDPFRADCRVGLSALARRLGHRLHHPEGGRRLLSRLSRLAGAAARLGALGRRPLARPTASAGSILKGSPATCSTRRSSSSS